MFTTSNIHDFTQGFLSGFGRAFGWNVSGGYTNGTAYDVGSIYGDLHAGALAVVGMAAGGAGEIGGGALDLTGVGAFIGVPVNIASLALEGGSAALAGRVAGNIAHDFENLFSHFTSDSSSGGVSALKFPKSNSDIKKVFGINARTFHNEVKPEILKQIRNDPSYKKEFGKLGNNPDIGIDRNGNIALKSTKNGRTLETDIPFNSFLP